MRLGDGVLSLAMLVWATVAVGPVWLGVVLFLFAGALNFAHGEIVRRKPR